VQAADARDPARAEGSQVSRVEAITVDPIACDGHGFCAELFPERISSDDWGYPMVDPTPIPASLQSHARRAVARCPKQALRLGRRSV
jgi:ferredoxin